MNADPTDVKGAVKKTRDFMDSINLEEISRKNHDKILYQIACLFRMTRSIKYRSTGLVK